MSRKIENGKVVIGKVKINVETVLTWMREKGHYITSVEARDHFDWPLRNTCRVLMRLLEEKGKVVIRENPLRKGSWCYGLKEMPKPTKKNFPKYTPPKTDKQLEKGKFSNNNKPKKPKEEKTKKPTEKQPSTSVTKKSKKDKMTVTKESIGKIQVENNKKLRRKNGLKPMKEYCPEGLTIDEFQKLLKDTKMSPEEFANMPTDMREKLLKANKETTWAKTEENNC